jgi:hypothetical protein
MAAAESIGLSEIYQYLAFIYQKQYADYLKAIDYRLKALIIR